MAVVCPNFDHFLHEILFCWCFCLCFFQEGSFRLPHPCTSAGIACLLQTRYSWLKELWNQGSWYSSMTSMHLKFIWRASTINNPGLWLFSFMELSTICWLRAYLSLNWDHLHKQKQMWFLLTCRKRENCKFWWAFRIILEDGQKKIHNLN